MGRKIVAVVGWGLGILVASWVAFVAVYSVLVPDCVTDGDLRDARLHIALNAAVSALALAGSVAVTVRLRRTLDDERRFLAGPAFTVTAVASFVVVLLCNGVTATFLDVPDAVSACF